MPKLIPSRFPWPSWKRVISADPDDNELEMMENEVARNEIIKKRSVAGALSYFLRTFAINILQIVATILLNIFLTPAEFGVYAIVIALIGLFNFLSDVGLAASLIQKKEKPTLIELRTTFTVQLMLALLIVGLIVVFTPVWKGIHNFGTTELLLLYAMAGSFVISSLKTIPSILLERQLRFDKVVIPAFVENISFYLIVVLLAWQGWGVSSYTLAVVVRSVLGLIAMYLIQSWPVGLAFDWAAFKGLINFGVKVQLNDLLARLKDELLVVILGWWLGLTEIGYLTFAKQWSMFPYRLTVQSVLGITFPTFSRIQEETEKLQKALHKSMYFISIVAFPLLIGLAAFIYPLLQVAPHFAKWQPAALSLSLFAISIMFASISTPLTNTLMAIAQINKNLLLMVMWTIMTWTLTPLFIWQWGYNGVALAAVVIGATSVAFPIYFVRKYVPKLTVWPHIWAQLLASLNIGLIGWIGAELWSKSIWWLIMGIVIAGLTYLVFFLTLSWQRFWSEIRSLGIIPEGVLPAWLK